MANGIEYPQYNAQQKASFLKNLWFGSGGVLLGLLFLVLIIVILNYFNIISLSKINPDLFGFLPHRPIVTSPTPTGNFTPVPTKPLVNLESCDVTKEGNALVSKVETIPLNGKNIIFGDFRGNINKVTFDEAKKSAKVEVISSKGEQEYTFTVNEEKDFVHDLADDKNKPLSILAQGQVVTMSFNCFPEKPKNEQFKITRITITSRL